MNAERWASVKRLLQSAVERPPAERDAYLQRECAGDDTLLKEVQSLIAAHAEADSFLDTAAVELKPGTSLGSYEIISMIGAGGMGEVYRARDTRIGRDVAIKRLPQSLGHDPDRLRRFEREARLAGSLNHPNLVTIHDVGTHDGAPFVVMELLKGHTLRDEIGRLSHRKAIEYAIQIATGLAAAHEQGIVHRDLKPENIFITDDGRVKILDFGLAKTIASTGESSAGLILGTAPYMSPEQVSGENVDVRSDIFSFGVILYEMLSGHYAFKRDSAIETMHAIVCDDVPDLASVSPFLNRIVRRCLEKKPAARFQSARDAGFALEDVEMATASAGSQPRRPRRWAMIGAAAIVVAAAIAAWSVAAPRPKPITYQRLTFRRGTITQARFAPDGRTAIFGAAFDGEPTRIFVKRPEGADSIALEIPPADLLSVSKSGELAILLEPRMQLPWNPIGTLARVSMNGGAPRRLVDDVISADWSPDGSTLAVVHDTGRDERLEIRSSDGGEILRQLFATSSGLLSHVRFSPSGDRIAFVVSPNRAAVRPGSVTVVNANGTGDAKPVGSAAAFSDLAWSADGREVWFADGLPVQTTIRAVSIKGGSRIVSRYPGHTGLADVAGTNVLITQNDVTARVACRGYGATADRDMSRFNWNLPLDITDDGRQLLLHTATSSALGEQVAGIKPLDGGPMTDLMRGGAAFAFTPDQRSVLVNPHPNSRPASLAFVPIGPGEKVIVRVPGLDAIAWALPAPDGKSLIVAGVTRNVIRLYVKTLADGRMRRITDDPIWFPFIAVSPDSAYVAAAGPTSRVTVYGIRDGKATVIPTSVSGDVPIRFGADGSLFYSRDLHLPNVIHRYDFKTQRDTVVREVAPADRTGVLYAFAKAMTPDGQCYCYQYAQVLSRLVLADGIK